ncbi:hypothetical protein TNCT_154431 [Trichonephila clavata]|uniref:Uncharacterized protein n=1 Tax=Trichonephila clavata TaxID=2740835 RepID=A0A8X6G746_TRICU|nr:hypothetical protein TNCT_154431 [Trichonephila clavata]
MRSDDMWVHLYQYSYLLVHPGKQITVGTLIYILSHEWYARPHSTQIITYIHIPKKSFEWIDQHISQTRTQSNKYGIFRGKDYGCISLPEITW